MRTRTKLLIIAVGFTVGHLCARLAQADVYSKPRPEAQRTVRFDASEHRVVPLLHTDRCTTFNPGEFLARQLATIDTVNVGDQLSIVKSDGSVRQPPPSRNLGTVAFFDLRPPATYPGAQVIVYIAVEKSRGFIGLIWRHGSVECAEKWSMPVEEQ